MFSHRFWSRLLSLCSLLIASCATEPALLAGEDAGAEPAIADHEQGLFFPPPPRCTSPAPRCGCGKYPLCSFGNVWLCMEMFEVCNGRDDNCNGEIDEGSTICSDGRECTNDICATRFDGSKVCLNLPVHRACNDGASCTSDLCIAPGGTIPAGFSAPDARGCSVKPEHDRCDDGCHCTGAETCDPESAGVSRSHTGTGCMPGVAPCERDGQFCTLEACCETGENCQPIRGSRAAIDFACSFSSYDLRQSGTGEWLRCPKGSRGPVTRPTPCDDENPCTADFCDEAGDRCGHTPLDGDVEGCSGTEDEGCTRKTCRAGQCTASQRSSASDGLPYPCTGFDGDSCWFKSCVPDRTRPGHGICNRSPQHDQCNDPSVFCMGEVCAPLNDPGLQFFSVPGKRRGCMYQGYTCDDGNSCTRDDCDDNADVCSHTDVCGGGPI